MSSLLAFVAARFGGPRQEPIATDSLGFMLSNSRVALHALAGLYRDATGENVEITRAKTEFWAGDESRPDLAMLGAGDKLLFFLEAKFWAGLTDAQPQEYLNRLREQEAKLLLFVVPASRLDSFTTAELSPRLGSTHAGSWSGTADLRVLRANGLPTIAVASWTLLLRTIGDSLARAGEANHRADLDQLAEFVQTVEREGFVPLTAEWLGDLSMPRALNALVDACDEAVQLADRTGVLTTKRLRPTHDWYTAGRYVSFPEAGCWIGLDRGSWVKFQVSPLWMWFKADAWGRALAMRELLGSWEAQIPRRLFLLDDGGLVVPLFVKPRAEKQHVVADLVVQLKLFRDALAPLGPLTTQAPD